MKFRKGKRAAIRGVNYETFADKVIKEFFIVKKVGDLKQKILSLNIAWQI